MQHCSQSEGIFKCLDNCLKKSQNDNETTKQHPNWEMDFSFFLKYHQMSAKDKEVIERRRDSINLVGKELALRKKCADKSLLMNVSEMATNHVRSSVRESAKAFMVHPVTQMYVEKRWQEVKWMYYEGVLLWRILYAALFNLYTTLVFNNLCPLTEGENDINWYSEKSTKLTDLNWINGLGEHIPCNKTNHAQTTFFSTHNPESAILVWMFLIFYTLWLAGDAMMNLLNNGMKTFRNLGTWFDVMVMFNFGLCSENKSAPLFKKEQIYRTNLF